MSEEPAASAEPAASGFDLLGASEELLSEVTARLQGQGFDGTLVIEPDAVPPGVRCRSCGHRHLPRRLTVVEAHRFEGPTSPEDEALLVALRCPTCGTGGVLVTAYGPAATAEEAEVLSELTAGCQPSPRDERSRDRRRRREVEQ